MREAVLFYVWQAQDKPRRNYLKRQLTKAAREVSKEGKVGLRIGSAAEDEPGSPKIDEVILRQLRNAEVVVVDIGGITQYEETAQQSELHDARSAVERRDIPNPNAMFELGYAFGTIGPGRVIMPAPTEMNYPFDIDHYRRLNYKFPNPSEDDTREFVLRLTRAIKSILESDSSAGLDRHWVEETVTALWMIKPNEWQSTSQQLNIRFRLAANEPGDLFDRIADFFEHDARSASLNNWSKEWLFGDGDGNRVFGSLRSRLTTYLVPATAPVERESAKREIERFLWGVRRRPELIQLQRQAADAARLTSNTEALQRDAVSDLLEKARTLGIDVFDEIERFASIKTIGGWRATAETVEKKISEFDPTTPLGDWLAGTSGERPIWQPLDIA